MNIKAGQEQGAHHGLHWLTINCSMLSLVRLEFFRLSIVSLKVCSCSASLCLKAITSSVKVFSYTHSKYTHLSCIQRTDYSTLWDTLLPCYWKTHCMSGVSSLSSGTCRSLTFSCCDVVSVLGRAALQNILRTEPMSSRICFKVLVLVSRFLT